MMRTHFISRLALLLAAGFLVVASQVWTGNTLQWLFFAGGIVMVVAAFADAIRRSVPQRVLDGVLVLLGAWTIIESLVLEGGDLKWWSFGSAAALAGLATIGLVLHEMSTERVVHELKVSAERGQREPAAPAAA